MELRGKLNLFAGQKIFRGRNRKQGALLRLTTLWRDAWADEKSRSGAGKSQQREKESQEKKKGEPKNVSSGSTD